MLDTHRLRIFLIAADTLNFSSAAKRLHMTQPSVSQHIQASGTTGRKQIVRPFRATTLPDRSRSCARTDGRKNGCDGHAHPGSYDQPER